MHHAHSVSSQVCLRKEIVSNLFRKQFCNSSHLIQTQFLEVWTFWQVLHHLCMIALPNILWLWFFFCFSKVISPRCNIIIRQLNTESFGNCSIQYFFLKQKARLEIYQRKFLVHLRELGLPDSVSHLWQYSTYGAFDEDGKKPVCYGICS